MLNKPYNTNISLNKNILFPFKMDNKRKAIGSLTIHRAKNILVKFEKNSEPKEKIK